MPPPLIGTYRPPRVRVGEVVTCLYRDAECVVTGVHDGPIPWPRVRAREHRGGSGLWVNATLARAIRTESAAALMHWFGVGVKAAWNWRRAFVPGPGHFRTRGSEAAHRRACHAGAAGIRAKVWTDAELDAKAARARVRARRDMKAGRWPRRWTKIGWTPAQLALLGTDRDEVIAGKVGRTAAAVRAKRWALKIPAYRPLPPQSPAG